MGALCVMMEHIDSPRVGSSWQCAQSSQQRVGEQQKEWRWLAWSKETQRRWGRRRQSPRCGVVLHVTQCSPPAHWGFCSCFVAFGTCCFYSPAKPSLRRRRIKGCSLTPPPVIFPPGPLSPLIVGESAQPIPPLQSPLALPCCAVGILLPAIRGRWSSYASAGMAALRSSSPFLASLAASYRRRLAFLGGGSWRYVGGSLPRCDATLGGGTIGDVLCRCRQPAVGYAKPSCCVEGSRPPS